MSGRFFVHTFGCQMNVHDSERMHEVLRRAGYAEVEPPARPTSIVLNTCSVREKAEQKLRSEVGRLAQAEARAARAGRSSSPGASPSRRARRCSRGCRAIDLVVGPDNIPELPAPARRAARSARRRSSRTVFDTRGAALPHGAAPVAGRAPDGASSPS